MESLSYQYQILGRLQADCEYFLNWGCGSVKRLWAGSVDEQIKEMKERWNRLEVKPTWLTMDQIEDYEKRMKSVN